MKWKGRINFELRPQLNGSNLLLTEGSGEISAVTEKTAPVSADLVLIEDSAASNAKKRAQLSNIRKINVQDEGSNVTNTPHTTLNFVGSPVTVTDGGSGVATVTMIFGQFFSQSSDDSESTTTSTTFQQKLRHTVSGLVAGTYRLSWYSEIRNNSTNNDVIFRVQQNDTTDLANVNIEAQDASSYFPNSGFVYLTLAASTTYNFDMDYRSEGGGTTAYIRSARFEFWRVA